MVVYLAYEDETAVTMVAAVTSAGYADDPSRDGIPFAQPPFTVRILKS